MWILRGLDWPPVWLAGFLALVWGLGQAVPLRLFGGTGQWAGGALVLLGLGVMSVAVVQMLLARTTFVPRRKPDALVTNGIFALSRNPIYLGDAMVLAGMMLRWDVPLALPLLAIFMLIIQARFIFAEEEVLRAGFGPAFEDWSRQTRRWL